MDQLAEQHIIEDETAREQRWAATMSGYGSEIRYAHSSRVAFGPGGVRRREEREELETALLAPGATRALGAGRRARPETADEWRTCFERDRDRILHSRAFRRLSGKTQVFIFPSDHQRTRLTHALEVAQVAVAIASSLRLNVALTEAIALGHDCGHGPGGHASEEAFADYLAEGYDHARWGADVVLRPLNLTAEVLDGIRNHSWSRPTPATPEGEVVSWADRIAYVCHDFEDAVRAGVVEQSSLPTSVRRLCGATRGEQLGVFIGGLVTTSSVLGEIAMPGEIADALADFRRFNYERVYLRPDSRNQARLVIEVLRGLVEYFAAHPRAEGSGAEGSGAEGSGAEGSGAEGSGAEGSGAEGSGAEGSGAEGSGAEGSGAPPAAHSVAAVRAAVGHVSGMTDRYAFGEAVARLGFSRARLPRGIDLELGSASAGAVLGRDLPHELGRLG